MKAVLFILVPMLILAGVMLFVFERADEPEEAERPGGGVEVVSAEPAGSSVESGDASAARPSQTAPKEAAVSRPSAEGAARREVARAAATEKALEAVDELVTIERTRRRRDRSAQREAAKRALGAGDLPAAIAAADRLLAVNPDDVEALSVRAEALVRMQRFGEAASVYERCVQLARDDLRLRYNYAVVLTRLRNFGDAVRNYEFILAHEANHTRAAYNLAVIYQEEGKLSDAARLWRRVCEASPDLADAWFNRGVVGLRLNDFETAVVALKQAAALDPNRVDTQTNLGVAYHESGRLPEAIAAFQEARKIKADYLPAVNGIAEVYLRYFEKDPEAQEHLECGLRWCDYSQSIQAYQPRLRSLYERALQARPDSVAAMGGLARLLAATPPDSPRYEAHVMRAKELCRKSLDVQPDQPEIAGLLKKLEGGT